MALQFDPTAFFLPNNDPLPAARNRGILKRPRDTTIEVAVGVIHKKIRFDTTVSESLSSQIAYIETSLEKRAADEALWSQSRARIEKILQQPLWPESKKMAHLGILGYYIGSGRALPAIDLEESLVSEIKDRFHYFKCDKKIYLLQQFAKWIFPANGGFNRAGCMTVQTLLAMHFHKHFSVEERKRVLECVLQLINREPLLELFRKGFEIYLPLQNPIHEEMGIPSEESLSFVDLRWNLLLFLFQKRPTQLGKLFEVLERGYFLHGGREIEIDSLLPFCKKRVEEGVLASLEQVIAAFVELNDSDEKMDLCWMIREKVCNRDSDAVLKWMEEHFFIYDIDGVEGEIVQNRLFFDSHTASLTFEGSSATYASFQRIRRLFILENGSLTPIDTLTALGACLQLEMSSFSITHAAQFVADYNQSCSLRAARYQQDDAFVLIPLGVLRS